MARKEHKYHFIYKTTNTKNDKYYIGMHSTSNLDDGYIGSGKRLRNSIRFHGKECHKMEILEYFNSRVDLAKKESELVNAELLKDPMCMNLVIGGFGNFPEWCTSGETHKLICIKAGEGIKRRLKNDPILREEYAKRGSIQFKKLHENGVFNYNTFGGKKHSNDTINKMKDSKKGQGSGSENSQFGTCWVFSEIEGSKKIKKHELDLYLFHGWIKGRRNDF